MDYIRASPAISDSSFPKRWRIILMRTIPSLHRCLRQQSQPDELGRRRHWRDGRPAYAPRRPFAALSLRYLNWGLVADAGARTKVNLEVMWCGQLSPDSRLSPTFAATPEGIKQSVASSFAMRKLKLFGGSCAVDGSNSSR